MAAIVQAQQAIGVVPQEIAQKIPPSLPVLLRGPRGV